MYKKMGKVVAISTLAFCMSVGLVYQVEGMVGGKPVIGISWKSNTQDYAAFKKIIEKAGGVPVELGQIKSTAVPYSRDGSVAKIAITETGNLKQEYADKIKAKKFDETNIATVMQGVDGVFGTGGEDVSPSLYKIPDVEKNRGEAINATRDISDYTLQAYCLEKNIPVFDVCRSEQMLGIVSGSKFIQDINDHYNAQGKPYDNLHRVPPGTPHRDYARHDVEVFPVKSHLYEIVGKDTLKNVSSWHHQSVGDIKGTDLIQTAQTIHDGVAIVEGIENPKKKFAVGVQFHPEND